MTQIDRMAVNNANVVTPIKDLKPGMSNLNMTFIVIEIGRPTTTKENQVSGTYSFIEGKLKRLYS